MMMDKIMDDIRSEISPKMKLQLELSAAIANRLHTNSNPW